VSSSPGGLLPAMIAAAAKRPSLLQTLRLAQADLQGDVLTLTMPSEFALMAEMHVDEYRQFASQAAGRPVKVKIETGGAMPASAAGEPEATPAESRKRDLMQQASREPAVQEAMELFGGRLIDVRESSSKEPS
jgi:hypothetical protein